MLSILVNIYGSKALFVNEFRSMLSDKLLNASDYDTDREVRNLELLKKRFGPKEALEVIQKNPGAPSSQPRSCTVSPSVLYCLAR